MRLPSLRNAKILSAMHNLRVPQRNNMQAGSHDVVIRQAAVFDGHGNPPFIADVAIDDDRIADVWGNSHPWWY